MPSLRRHRQLQRLVHLVLVSVLLPLGLAWGSPTALAGTVVDPYVAPSCVTGDLQPTLLPPDGICASAASMDSGASYGIAISPDGTRVYQTLTNAIALLSRDPVTGALSWVGCWSDPAGDPSLTAKGCTSLPAHSITDFLASYASAMVQMAVTPDGTTLFTTDGHRLTQFSLSGGGLSEVQCWKSVNDASSSDPADCTIIDTGAGDLIFDTLPAMAVSSDGTSVYALIDGIRNVGSTWDSVSAVLRFGRDTTTGATAYTGCAGTIVGRTLTVSTVAFTPVGCTGGDAYSLRLGKSLAVSPDGNSVYAAGIADLPTNTAPWGVARLTPTAGGGLANGGCILTATGTSCPDAADWSNPLYPPLAMAVSPDSRDIYVRGYPETHLRLTGSTMALLNDFTDATSTLSNSVGLAFSPDGSRLYSANGTFDSIRALARDTTTGALTGLGCVGVNLCDPTPVPPGYTEQGIAMTPDGSGLVTSGAMVTSWVAGQTLTVTGAGAGGSVSSSPAGLSCSSSPCSSPFLKGTVVTLTASAGTGYLFTGWTGDCTGTGTCQVTMDGARSVGATFSTAHTLRVSIGGAGTLTSSPAGISCGGTAAACSAVFLAGTVVTLTPAAAPGYAFNGWLYDCAGASATCSLTMDADHLAGAVFNQAFTLTVTNGGGGTISSSPAGISCGATCSAPFVINSTVSLTATPDAGHVFGGWSGACSGTGGCSVTMSADQAVSATWVSVPAITSFTPTSAGAGATVEIDGVNLGGATGVAFGGVAVTRFIVVSPTQILTSVPSRAKSGPITVVTPAGTASSPTSFTVSRKGVAPTVTSFSPAAGPVGTLVTINGTNLLGTTAVKFNKTAASTITVVSPTQITAVVPSGARTGKISVTTAGGTASSASSFTVQ